MTTLRRKLLEIEAVQWTGANKAEVEAFLDSFGKKYHLEDEDNDLVVVQRDQSTKISVDYWLTVKNGALLTLSPEEVAEKFDVL